MGVAVSGMHYTGMAAMRVSKGSPGMPGMQVTGSTASSFLLPLVFGISMVALLLTLVVSLSRTADEIAEDARIEQRLTDAASRASVARVTVRPAPSAIPVRPPVVPAGPPAAARPAPPPAERPVARPAERPVARPAEEGAGAPAPDEPLATRVPGASGRGKSPGVR